MKEDLNENTYTNDAYKLYLSDPKHEYSLQNTKVHNFYPCSVFSHEFLVRISAPLTWSPPMRAWSLASTRGVSPTCPAWCHLAPPPTSPNSTAPPTPCRARSTTACHITFSTTVVTGQWKLTYTFIHFKNGNVFIFVHDGKCYVMQT